MIVDQKMNKDIISSSETPGEIFNSFQKAFKQGFEKHKLIEFRAFEESNELVIERVERNDFCKQTLHNFNETYEVENYCKNFMGQEDERIK
jgi:hypothetical protein